MKANIHWKNVAETTVVLLLFVVASMIYFWPAVQGKVVYAADNVQGTAAVHEGHAFHETTGEYTWWNGSMFCGMPNYQLGGHGEYAVDEVLHPLRWFFSWGNRNAAFIFLFYLIAFYLLARSFQVNRWLSLAGAFAIAMSSYFFVIIAAQHHGKCYSITWMALVVAGFVLTYRRHYAWGGLIIAFFTYIGFFLHPQMSYYISMLIGVLWFAQLGQTIRDHEWRHFGIATAVFFAMFALGFGMGSGNIFVTQEYAQQTMRGGHSDLVKEGSKSQPTGGLDLDYATTWSYGKAETMTLLIPNYMGGCSQYDLGKDSQLEQDLRRTALRQQAREISRHAPTYWGEKPFTSGPVYIGAIVCMLFVLSFFVAWRSAYWWGLLVATLFSITLAWGHNLMGLTELFFHYFPMYNKFRAVESILIVAEIAMPLMGLLALHEISKHPGDRRLGRATLIAGGLTAAVCLFVALAGSGFDVTSSFDAPLRKQVDQYDPAIYQAILHQRQAMMTADAWRSLLFVLLGTAVVYGYTRYRGTRRHLYCGLALTALMIADIWPVDKRYCNDANFVSARDRNREFTMQPYEKQLLSQDRSYYRVLNLTTSTFNDARTSYYLKSIGGYSAAKLRRYQDLIDEHISKMHMPVISMLNGKYIITKDKSGKPYPYYNDQALGNAWLVDSLVAVDNANAESDALMQLDLRHQAVYDETYAPNAGITDKPEFSVLVAYEEQGIWLQGDYSPRKLTYLSRSERPRTAVFSEIYYPYGWHATIDGEPTDIYRVNYTLRAITIPSGEHEIVFEFEPESVRLGNMLSLSCLGLFLLLLAAAIGREIIRRKKSAELHVA